jgi:uncharacterized protein
VSIPLDVRDLLSRPGATRAVHVEEPVEGLRAGLVRVPEDAPVDADLLLERVVDGILASGELTCTVVETCARCLAPIRRPFQVDVQELFAPAAVAEEVEGYPIDDDEIDLEPMIRDAVVLAMPYSPLCSPGCKGLCERCGGDRNLDECSCGPVVDERWAPLAGLVLPDDPADGRSN